MDMLMASGAFILPHLIPYNLLPLTPALARVKPWQAGIAMVLSWLPFSANWIGPSGWMLGWFYVIWLWLCLAAQRYPEVVHKVQDIFQKNLKRTSSEGNL
jgi:hypothetical protein